MLTVKNMTSPRSGRPVPNQFIISETYHDQKVSDTFVSYKTTIARANHAHGELFVSAKKYSRTTSKYTRIFISRYSNYRLIEVESFE